MTGYSAVSDSNRKYWAAKHCSDFSRKAVVKLAVEI